MEKQALYSRESGITKNPFHKNKKPVNVNEVDIKRITLSNKKSYGNEDLFKTLLDLDIKVMLFQHRYV